MRFDPQAGVTWLTARFRSRRGQPRLRQEALQSSLGPVVDLSMGGARVLARRAPHGCLEVRITDGRGALALDAQVMWSRRLGFRRHELGLRFLGVTPQTAALISRLATDHRYRRLVDAA